jgi:hypothetical protein
MTKEKILYRNRISSSPDAIFRINSDGAVYFRITSLGLVQMTENQGQFLGYLP